MDPKTEEGPHGEWWEENGNEGGGIWLEMDFKVRA